MLITKNKIKKISKKRIKEIDGIPDSTIDYSDIPELEESFFRKVILAKKIEKRKISIRIDEDILAWLKEKREKGYQTLINQILRTYYNAQHKK